ncbi:MULTISPECIES: nicotinate-nucleotide--dimethylbenzimidazole phosphoribosyltransferase [Methylosinus]|uniref:Nicotinate-nucleotide--dimethylbenzimidazole phosphoribosyltransferase n=1 Tax=Methylosinus trichosporium (strain ATCC 35070 / NCIMB 11131 / UNIQEM 75 / OB3b) TaxID=595536 RepID=A0A2D2CVR4_METT3|nr:MULTISPECIES: nicotinate-nucleotide--dimethylbenzimidazole phosphoribosyltransferase [Methylosinus]ATQ66878.1 nicotinate-nucleotide--dimethylbenzimidazole phosphoribosyltransferase [Methylosinus trichosporium OB3b]OBS54252.1 nicotinate-nucleotide--dimethylbenzimidazole phosphoribosyltransferase [Methylosinus sp. 3S-1]
MTYQPPVLPPFDPAFAARLRARLDGLAKPPGSLGRLEDLALQLALIQGTEKPRIERVTAFVFAGDHGLTAEGVSAYPSAVTTAMTATFLAGRASVNALAAACGVEVVVVDAGVDADLPAHAGLIDAKIRRGSRNAAVEPALTEAEVEAALIRGSEIAAASGAEALVIGEMGIGNSAAAALIMHRLAPAPLADCVGAGAGHDSEGLARKYAALERAAARTSATEPLAVLGEFGGLEIAMMAGAFLGGAAAGKAMVVDGFISSAAALAALRLSPGLSERLIFAHVSAERGHAGMMAAIGARPLLDLSMRLGEGSGGALAAPLLRAAARLMSETAALEEVLAGRFAL